MTCALLLGWKARWAVRRCPCTQRLTVRSVSGQSLGDRASWRRIKGNLTAVSVGQAAVTVRTWGKLEKWRIWLVEAGEVEPALVLLCGGYSQVPFKWSRRTKPRESRMPESSTPSIWLCFTFYESLFWCLIFLWDSMTVCYSWPTSQFKEIFLQRLLNRSLWCKQTRHTFFQV